MIFDYLSKRARKRRAQIFNDYFDLSGDEKILDLGGGDGRHINLVLPHHPSSFITVADIRRKQLEVAQRKYKYNTVVLGEEDSLPFDDNYFDIIYCSSVIEHVTIPKKEIYQVKKDKVFRKRAFLAQQRFAQEIRRCGLYHYVQTPYKYFFIESHTFSPFFVVFLKRRMQIKYINLLNKFWIKKTSPDWHLLDRTDMKKLFPNSELVEEKMMGLTKSLIAIRSKNFG